MQLGYVVIIAVVAPLIIFLIWWWILRAVTPFRNNDEFHDKIYPG